MRKVLCAEVVVRIANLAFVPNALAEHVLVFDRREIIWLIITHFHKEMTNDTVEVMKDGQCDDVMVWISLNRDGFIH